MAMWQSDDALPSKTGAGWKMVIQSTLYFSGFGLA